jgi:hypothetical protein
MWRGTRGKNGACSSVPDVGTSSNVLLGDSETTTSRELPHAKTPYRDSGE